jgi:hypothetical protein
VVLCKAFHGVSIVFTSLYSFIFHYLQFVIIFDIKFSRHLLDLRLYVYVTAILLVQVLGGSFCYRKPICTMKSV